MDRGRIVLDAPRDDAIAWLAEHRPLYLPHAPAVACDVRSVSFSYGDAQVLDGVSLTVARGEIVALIGPNGVGKTTLALIACGLLAPHHGEVSHGRAAYLAQDPGRHVVTERVLDEVALGADEKRACAALAKVDLTELAGRHPRDLSSGERERLALARSWRSSRSSSCSTNRRGGSTPSARKTLRGSCGRRRRPAARSWSRTTCRGRSASPTGSSRSTSARASVRRLALIALALLVAASS